MPLSLPIPGLCGAFIGSQETDAFSNARHALPLSAEDGTPHCVTKVPVAATTRADVVSGFTEAEAPAVPTSKTLCQRHYLHVARRDYYTTHFQHSAY
jgi:hypothetical protein